MDFNDATAATGWSCSGKKKYIPSPLCDEDIGISMLDAKYLEIPASVLSNQISLLVGWNQFSSSRPAAFDMPIRYRRRGMQLFARSLVSATMIGVCSAA